MNPLLVSSHSVVKAVAGAVSWRIRRNELADLIAVGPAAVSRAVKAVALAHTYMSLEGVEISTVPVFEDVLTKEGTTLRAIRFYIRWTRRISGI